MSNPLRCERCSRPLESDDAISIIEGVCAACRTNQTSAVRPRRHVPRIPPNLVPPVPPIRQPISVSPPRWPSIDPPSARVAPGVKRPAQRLPTALPMFEPKNSVRVRRRRRDLAIGIVVGLVITIGTASYILIGKSDQAELPKQRGGPAIPIVLTVKPPHASVMLDDKPVGPPDQSGRLKIEMPNKGSVMSWLEVSAQGYHPVRRPVSIYGGVGDVTIELIQKPYEVAVRTEPPNAEVWINNEMKGFSPLTTTLNPGEKARLAVKRAGYDTITQELSPPQDKERLDLDFKLALTSNIAPIETEPSGAQIAVNGQVKAIAPCTLPIDPSWHGKKIMLTASLAGYEEASTTLEIPATPGQPIPKTYLRLEQGSPQLQITTNPAGGRVTIDGQDRGTAPVTAKFPASKAGSTIVVEASLGATHYGRQEIAVPPPGQATKMDIPLVAAAQSVVFVLASSKAAGIDHFALTNQISERIHRLGRDQRFALLVSTESGLRAWPEGGPSPTATSDQKIRVYDLLRSLRPTERGDLTAALDAALKLQPTAIWLFSADPSPAELNDRLGPLFLDRNVALHVVVASAGPDDGPVRDWLTHNRGSYSLLGRDRLPAIALDGNDRN